MCRWYDYILCNLYSASYSLFFTKIVSPDCIFNEENNITLNIPGGNSLTLCPHCKLLSFILANHSVWLNSLSSVTITYSLATPGPW